MKNVNKDDINNMNGIIMELPPFADQSNKEDLKNILNEFFKDIYINQTQELFDVLDFKLSPRMQETFFSNYGIDKKYSRRLKGYIKKDIGYHLEGLFQNKGSKIIFKIFSQIFENIFRKINFYNVEVHKIPTNSNFRYEYQLDPVYITDQNSILKYPQMPIEQSRKYLMELPNYKNYKVWPVPTNLIYIQFSIGDEIINNMNVFLDGIRSYASTYLLNSYFKFKNRDGHTENIHLADIEFIIQYFQLELIKFSNPDMVYDFPDRVSSFLMDNEVYSGINKKDFLCSMQSLIFDYQDANYADIDEMESLKRRWQFFLKNHEKEIDEQRCHHSTFDEIDKVMTEKYPLLKQDIIYYIEKKDQEKEPLLDFTVRLYASFISGVYTNQLIDNPSTLPNEGGCGNSANPRDELQLGWVLDYVDAIFSALFTKDDFIKFYFNPVMDLFIRYFFPVEMEYVNDLIKKVFIRDKWNVWATGHKHLTMVRTKHSSIQTPIRGLDYQKYWLFLTGTKSYIDKISLPSTWSIIPSKTQYKPNDKVIPYAFSRPTERDIINDKYAVKIIDHNGNTLTRVNYRFSI